MKYFPGDGKAHRRKIASPLTRTVQAAGSGTSPGEMRPEYVLTATHTRSPKQYYHVMMGNVKTDPNAKFWDARYHVGPLEFFHLNFSR